MEQWAYDMPAAQLVNELIHSAARASVSGSGLVIDMTGPFHAAETRYLVGVVVSKLEGKTPPFRWGVKVRATRRVTSSCRNWSQTIEASAKTFTIARIYYHSSRWLLSFEEIQDGDKGPYLFDVAAFEEVAAEATTAAAGDGQQVQAG